MGDQFGDREPQRFDAMGSHTKARGDVVIQTKLVVGRSDDPLEHEADRVADHVMRALASPGPTLPDAVQAGDGASVGRVRRSAVMRRAAPESGAPIGPEGGPVGDEVAARVQRASSGGKPLEPATRERMGGAFGVDFSHVRIHRGSESDSLNRSLGARAFTSGSNVFLGSDAPSAGSSEGDHLLAHELTHTIQQGSTVVARSISLAGKVQRAPATIQRDDTVVFQDNPLYEAAPKIGGDNPLYEPPSAVVYPLVGEVRGEAVIFEQAGDKFDATFIMNKFETVYGVSIRSDKLAKAIPSNYKRAPKDVRAAVATGVWQMKELRALDRALAHFAPLLGAARKDSTLKGSQEIKYIGKVKKGIDENSSEGVLDSTTMGEFFKKQKTFGMFDVGTDSTEDFADNLQQIEGTAVHEMAHGLFGYLEKAWLKEFDFWSGMYVESGKDSAEAPPSDYGQTNVSEDMCESVMFYFVDENRLKTSAPLRHAFLTKAVGDWKKEQKKAKKK
jgi:hypothetical protein